MKQDEVKHALARLDNIVSCVKLQNSGADSHIIGNIRNTATLLKYQLETDPDCIEDELVFRIIKNTEELVVDFYKKKFNGLRK